jgi:hypothetical protein
MTVLQVPIVPDASAGLPSSVTPPEALLVPQLSVAQPPEVIVAGSRVK